MADATIVSGRARAAADSTVALARTQAGVRARTAAQPARRAAGVPETIGKYKIYGTIAEGGMGVVYKAEHPSLKRQVIIKKLTIRGNAAIRERFKREAQILLDLQSPYIVHLHDYFVEGSSHYIVEEFVDGMALDNVIKKNVSLPAPLAMLIFLDACLALRYAHNKGIVHRDIKPGNILISRRAEIKLADFGIASSEKEDAAGSEKSANLTQAGMTLGTPAYMSPEQFEDSSTVDQRADIYAMGVMLYEMVTGTKPYPGSLTPETMLKIQKSDYIPPEKIDRNIPPVVGRLVRKMLRADKEKRYQSMDPVIRTVRHYLRRFDTHALRVELARSIVTTREYSFPEFLPKKRTGLKVALCTAGAAALVGLSSALWHAGAVHRTVLRHWYTPVTLALTMPASSTAGADLNVQAFFFENDSGGIPEVKGSRRTFYDKNANSAQEQKEKSLSTKAVFLKPGKYRVKVVVGPCIWWQSFSVTSEQLDVPLDFLSNAVRQLTVHASARDAETGSPIDGASFFVAYNGKWVPLASVPKSALVTGTVHKIKAGKDGYKDEEFSLKIDWFQDELYITASLEKKQ